MFLQIISGSIEISHQLTQAKALPKPYFSQITYSSAPVLRKLLNNPSQPNSNLATLEIFLNLARFTSTSVLQSYIYIVQILKILEFNLNNKRDDNPIYLSRLYIIMISLSGRKLCKPNMTLSLKMKLENSHLCQKIDKLLLVNGILN